MVDNIRLFSRVLVLGNSMCIDKRQSTQLCMRMHMEMLTQTGYKLIGLCCQQSKSDSRVESLRIAISKRKTMVFRDCASQELRVLGTVFAQLLETRLISTRLSSTTADLSFFRVRYLTMMFNLEWSSSVYCISQSVRYIYCLYKCFSGAQYCLFFNFNFSFNIFHTTNITTIYNISVLSYHCKHISILILSIQILTELLSFSPLRSRYSIYT